MFALGVLRNYIRQKAAWLDYRLIVDTHRNLDFRQGHDQRRVSFHEISGIYENPVCGLYIKIGDSSRTIRVPRQLIGYSELRQFFLDSGSIETIEIKPSRGVYTKAFLPTVTLLLAVFSPMPIVSLFGSIGLLVVCWWQWMDLSALASNNTERRYFAGAVLSIATGQLINVFVQLSKIV